MKRKSKNLYTLSKLLFEQEEGEEEEVDTDEDPEGEESEEPETDDEESDNEPPEAIPDNIDADIEAVLIDFEASARKSSSEEVKESLALIYEVDEDIDLDIFAGEVARLVKNYDNLIDMEKMLVDKAKDFITSRYGEKEGIDLQDKLATQHDIEIDRKSTSLDSDLNTPLAVGATLSGE
jgi:hypothetical protein